MITGDYRQSHEKIMRHHVGTTSLQQPQRMHWASAANGTGHQTHSPRHPVQACREPQLTISIRLHQHGLRQRSRRQPPAPAPTPALPTSPTTRTTAARRIQQYCHQRKRSPWRGPTPGKTPSAGRRDSPLYPRHSIHVLVRRSGFPRQSRGEPAESHRLMHADFPSDAPGQAHRHTADERHPRSGILEILPNGIDA